MRKLVPGDAEALFGIYQDAQTMRYMGLSPATVEAERGSVEAHAENYYRRHGFGLWGIVLRETGQIIGRSGLLRFDLDDTPQTEISYLIARRHWGAGYATEAAEAVVRLAFDDMKIDKLHALINPANAASSRVALRLNFRLERAVEYKCFGLVDLYARYPRQGRRLSSVKGDKDLQWSGAEETKRPKHDARQPQRTCGRTKRIVVHPFIGQRDGKRRLSAFHHIGSVVISWLADHRTGLLWRLVSRLYPGFSRLFWFLMPLGAPKMPKKSINITAEFPALHRFFRKFLMGAEGLEPPTKGL